MQLQLDHATVKPLGLRQVLQELGRRLSIQEELEPVSIHNDVELVPSTLVNILYRDRILQRRDSRLVILPDHQAIAPEAAMLTAARGVEVPSPEDISPDPDMSDIRVVTLELSSARLVNPRPDVNSAVSLARKTVEELELEIGDFLVLAVGEIPPPLVTLSYDHSVHHTPSLPGEAGHFLPSVESLPIEDGLETIIVLLGVLASMKQPDTTDHYEPEETENRIT